jgi:hypothetical protein
MTQHSRPNPTQVEDRKTHLVGTEPRGARVRNPMTSSSSLFGGWGPRLR